MFSVERHVGTLVECRLSAPLTRDELAAFGRERLSSLRVLGDDLVACIDCRGLDVLPPELTDELVAALRLGPSSFRRSAVLAAAGKAVLALQLDRIVREAKNPARRLFRDRDALVAWLSEILAADERARLLAFLDGER